MSFNSFSTSDFNLEGLPDKKKTEPGPKPVKIWGLLLSFELLSSLRMTSNSFRRCKSFENVSSLVKNLSSLIELMAVVDGHKSYFKTSWGFTTYAMNQYDFRNLLSRFSNFVKNSRNFVFCWHKLRSNPCLRQQISTNSRSSFPQPAAFVYWPTLDFSGYT